MKKILNLFSLLIVTPTVAVLGFGYGADLLNMASNFAVFGGLTVLFATCVITCKLLKFSIKKL